VRTFKIGDRARIIKSKKPERVGLVVTIVSDLTNQCSCGATHPSWEAGYHIDLPNMHAGHESCAAWYMPWSLVPVYDGHETVSWESCVWQPNRVTG
jgi:hypothetical protein